MTGSEVKTIIDACDARDLNYKILTMNPTNINKNENTVVKINGDNVIGFRRPIFSENNGVGGIEAIILPVEQLCEMKITGDYDNIKSLSEEIGVEFSEEDLAILIHMDKYETALEPETGNYNRFRYKRGAEYNLMTDEEKEEYENAKTAYEKAEETRLGKNQAASISLN